MTKPHITKRAGLHVCTGRGISVESATASGAFIAWARETAMALIFNSRATHG